MVYLKRAEMIFVETRQIPNHSGKEKPKITSSSNRLGVTLSDKYESYYNNAVKKIINTFGGKRTATIPLIKRLTQGN